MKPITEPNSKAKKSGENWEERPDLYEPKPRTVLNIMRWHVAIHKLIDQAYDEANPHLRGKVFYPMGQLKESDRADELYRRDRDFMYSLEYENFRLVEAAVLVGRDYWYKELTGAPAVASCQKMGRTSVFDLESWAKYYDIPPDTKHGGHLRNAIEYTTDKRSEIWEAYIKAAEKELRSRKKSKLKAV